MCALAASCILHGGLSIRIWSYRGSSHCPAKSGPIRALVDPSSRSLPSSTHSRVREAQKRASMRPRAASHAEICPIWNLSAEKRACRVHTTRIRACFRRIPIDNIGRRKMRASIQPRVDLRRAAFLDVTASSRSTRTRSVSSSGCILYRSPWSVVRASSSGRVRLHAVWHCPRGSTSGRARGCQHRAWLSQPIYNAHPALVCLSPRIVASLCPPLRAREPVAHAATASTLCTLHSLLFFVQPFLIS